MHGILRALTVIFGLLFLFAVIVQYNDPDPLQWMAIYLAAAIACILALTGRASGWLPMIVGIIAAIWMGMLLPRVVGQVGAGDLFREAGMATLAIEEGREALGLALVAIWMFVLAFAARRRAALTNPA